MDGKECEVVIMVGFISVFEAMLTDRIYKKRLGKSGYKKRGTKLLRNDWRNSEEHKMRCPPRIVRSELSR
jgi:hypothetical protein